METSRNVQTDYGKFIQMVLECLDRIDERYFFTSFENFHQFNASLKNLGKFKGEVFYRYSERGLAYELYHQLRNELETYRKKRKEEGRPEFFKDYFLQGEVKKMDVEEVTKWFKYESLGGKYSPDILFHIPSLDANAFVLEIKAQPTLTEVEIDYDLRKLSKFLHRLNYRRAIFISVNIDFEELTGLIHKKHEKIIGHFGERLHDCIIINKKFPGIQSPTIVQTLDKFFEL